MITFIRRLGKLLDATGIRSHNTWAANLSTDLNQRLPEGYFAEAKVQFGIEIDVATFEETVSAVRGGSNDWMPPVPRQSIPLPIVTDHVEVLVFNTSKGGRRWSVRSSWSIRRTRTGRPTETPLYARLSPIYSKESGSWSSIS